MSITALNCCVSMASLLSMCRFTPAVNRATNSLYSLRNDQRWRMCAAVESTADWKQSAAIIEAQRRADSDILAHTLPTLRIATAAEVAAESIHQLFWNRLVSEGDPDGLGGRVAQFYLAALHAGEVLADWET
ncbi:hypothetical protein LZ023_39445 (plasmid) [Pseudomonas silvicola]|nr:hypothetical protein LZ023_39445 [Pseudomonas silvicola]